MEILSVLQIIFDAVLLFGILFLFHYVVQRSEKKKEDSDILNDLRVQEIKDGLQEMLLTLKQLGKEVSDNLQERVKEAEDKTESLRKLLAKLDRDLGKVDRISREVESERSYLESKKKVLGISRPKKKEGAKFEARRKASDASGPEGGPSAVLPLMEANPQWSAPLLHEVYRMADKKIGLVEIAQKTRLSRAEVQLILNLRGNRFTTPN